jgi:RsiW-degrading membrane proteinase PrsW (M82 family)
MNKAIFVILIAIIGTLIPLMFQFYTRGREISPATQRLLWVTFIAGAAILIVTFILVIVT